MKTDEQLLEEDGWRIECESPLEIRDVYEIGFASGHAAEFILAHLRYLEFLHQTPDDFVSDTEADLVRKETEKILSEEPNIPEQKENIDWSFVLAQLGNIMVDVAENGVYDNDMKQRIFESVLEAVYGQEVME
jgi:hypothetical protein